MSLIGGTACDRHLSGAGFDFRPTRDLDLILIVETYSTEFVQQFREFIKAGSYCNQEKSNGERKHYRFTKPTDDSFPYQIELFSRKIDKIFYL